MASQIPVRLAFGAAGPLWSSDEDAPKALEILKEEGVKDIDSARGYGDSEEKLGERGTPKEFIVSTKFSGAWSATPATRENILQSAETSFELLKTDQVDIYYLHAPDRSTPLEETLGAIDELYKQGRFRRFGLSNYLPEEVEEIVRITKEKGFVVPSVYQGNYSAVSRKPEDLLFPVLRKHNFSFYAYSPIAGGFLTKTRKQVEEAVNMRWDASNPLGKIYTTLYSKPSFLDALSKWESISADTGIAKAELAYRWIVHHSALKQEHGDAVIFGATRLGQVRETIQGVKRGPLSDKVVEQIQAVWDLVKDDAGLDNYNLNNASASATADEKSRI